MTTEEGLVLDCIRMIPHQWISSEEACVELIQLFQVPSSEQQSTNRLLSVLAM
jgi:hypothetical protein